MKLIDPTVHPTIRTRSRAPVLDSLHGKTIGLLSNGKLNADLLLTTTAGIFAERHGCSVTKIYGKPSASAPAPADTLVELAEDCDFLITANGD